MLNSILITAIAALPKLKDLVIYNKYVILSARLYWTDEKLGTFLTGFLIFHFSTKPHQHQNGLFQQMVYF